MLANAIRLGRRVIASVAFLLLPIALSVAAPVALPAGQKSITLVSGGGMRLPIGHVTFVGEGDAAKISVKLDAPQFTDEFLSMRPFRCLTGPDKMWCHLPYPYETSGRVTATDLGDLEYALMFIWRTFDRVGADAYNGLYFKLELAPDGSISGGLNEADLNVLAVRPAEGITRPVSHSDLTPVEPGRQLYDRIEIR